MLVYYLVLQVSQLFPGVGSQETGSYTYGRGKWIISFSWEGVREETNLTVISTSRANDSRMLEECHTQGYTSRLIYLLADKESS